MPAVVACLKWLATHPFQIATVVLAIMVYHYHGALVTTRTDMAQTCHAVDPDKADGCMADVVNVVASRDAYKLAAADNQRNADAAAKAGASCQVALTEVHAELERTQTTQAAAQARADSALRELRKARNTIAAASAREAMLRANLYANDPVCTAWGAALVCPAVDHLLRFPAGQAGPTSTDAGHGHVDGHSADPAIPFLAAPDRGHATVAAPAVP
jgi:hypothetical protein